jgi:hypothetical protein
MKLLLLIVPREARDDAEAALEAAGALGFTEIPGVYGEGATGPRFGSRTAPGVSDLVFVALEDEQVDSVRQALAAMPRAGRVHAFLVPARELSGIAPEDEEPRPHLQK